MKTVIFISKIAITTTSPILHFVPMRTYICTTSPIAPKRAEILLFGTPQPFISIPVVFNHKLLFGPAVHICNIAIESQVTVLSVCGQDFSFFNALFGMLLKGMGERFLLSKDEPLTPNINGVMTL